MRCSKWENCANFGRKCDSCQAMSDMQNNYPHFVDNVDQMNKLMKLLLKAPDLFDDENSFTYNMARRAEYLVSNGVRVEE